MLELSHDNDTNQVETIVIIYRTLFMHMWSEVMRTLFSGEENWIDTNFDINETTSCGTGLLHAAVLNERPKVIETLIAKGCSVDIQNNLGETPLHWAVLACSVQCCKALLYHGADVDGEDYDGNTPLLWACDTLDGNPCIQLLLQHKADVNRENFNGDVPLSLAARNGNIEVLQVLLQQPLINVDFVNMYTFENLQSCALFSEHEDTMRICNSLVTKATVENKL